MHSSEVDIDYPGLITNPKVTAVVIILTSSYKSQGDASTTWYFWHFIVFVLMRMAVAELCSRVPVGKGWLGAPLIKKRLRKVQKIEACNTREPCGVGSWGPLKGPGGVQGQSPWWGSRGRSPRKLLCISMRIQHFPGQHFQRKLIYVRLLS